MTNKDLSNVRAIVIDANVFREGELEVDVLNDWALLAAEEGLEIWIPEPVVWEFAEHAARRLEALEESYDSQRGRLLRAGIDLPPLPLGYLDVVDQVIADVRNLAPAVRVLELTPDVAASALRDQILVQPPGRFKGKGRNRVKTGAADSASLRLALAESGGNTQTWVLVSRDSDCLAAFREWKTHPPRIFHSLTELRETLLAFEAAPHEAALLVAHHVLALLGSGELTGALKQVSVRNADLISHSVKDAGWSPAIFEDQVEVERAKALADIHSVRLDRRTGSVTATVSVLADLRVTQWVEDQTEMRPVEISTVMHDARATPTFVLTVKDGQITRSRIESEMEAWPPDIRWESPSEALLACASIVEEFPLGEDPEPFHASSELYNSLINEGAATLDVEPETQVTLTLHEGPSDAGWTLLVRTQTGGVANELQLNCQHHPDPVDRWYATTREGPWLLTVAGNTVHFANPAWAIAELLTRHVTGNAMPANEPFQ